MHLRIVPLAALLVLSTGPANAAGSGAADGSAADAFMAALAGHCGHAYAGRIVANEPAAADDAFAGKALVMHVRECTADEIRVPFHVGDDRSRTWVITRTANGLRLKHDHRHQDGKPDKLTLYGGDTATPGTASRQEFPVDAESKALFAREGLTVSLTNVWAMEIDAGRRFVYELARPGRLFRVEFDLTEPVPAPPAPWGAAAEAAITRTWNWHSSAQRMVLVNGELQVTYDGQSAAILRPGMYAYGPPGASHTAVCRSAEPCVLFIAFDGPVDVRTAARKP